MFLWNKFVNIKDIGKLRKIYDSLETSVRNLADLNVEITSYEILLINIIFDPILSELKLLNPKKFKNNVFDLDILIEIFNKEFFARERVQAIDGNKNSNSDETVYFTRHICWIIQENLIKNVKKYDSTLKVCVYWGGKNHVPICCNTIHGFRDSVPVLILHGFC